MRRKRMGGRRGRLSKLPPHPSAMAFSYLPNDSEAHPDCSHDDIGVNEAKNDDGQRSTVPGTSRDSDHDRGGHELAPNSTGETVNLAESSCGLGPQEVSEPEDCSEIDWTEHNVCIKCGKGGKLLVCCEINCPLAVHEECIQISARFNSMGNFYCPYCSYKRAMLETRKARKKVMLAKNAFSVFLDKGMMDVGSQMPKVERVRRKEPSPSTVVVDSKHDDTRDRPDDDEADNLIVQMEEDRREKRFDICEGAGASAVNEQNDVLSRWGDNARPDDGGQHKVVIEQHMHPGPIIACGGAGVASCREEETGNRSGIVEFDKSYQPDHSTLVDDHQNERLLEDEQQACPLSASQKEKETELDDALHRSTDGESDNGDRVKEHEGSRVEEEVMQDQEQGTTAFSSGGDSMQQEHAKVNDLSDGDNGNVSPHWRHAKKKNQNGVQPSSADSRRGSARKLFKPNTNVVHGGKKNAINITTQLITSKGRRKKLLWTNEEEEMLKEGVQKFSTKINKNLPWRKILEFGHRVFDKTRMPSDLKDKWRNILAKERSQPNDLI